MPKKITMRIKIWGIVQGVGFRPYVAKLADRFHIKGQVRNVGGLVEIVLTDTEKHIIEFIKELERGKPDPAEIVHIKKEYIKPIAFNDFTISKSLEGQKATAMVAADQGICPNCHREMEDKNNPRYGHPFISCMICGPRYSIIDTLPYDRENTSMSSFSMCQACQGEYEDIHNRRYHAQTISCHDCGPQMEFKLIEKSLLTQKPPLEKAAALLREGRVIGFKSLGGYNLMANPFDKGAMDTLRRIKKREEKPFAIMFSNIEQIENYCKVGKTEKSLLQSSARPILLLERYNIRELENYKPRNYEELKKSRFIGAFLPAMGAQHILLDLFGGPLVVTSANMTGIPMISKDEDIFQMMEECPDIAETFYNTRNIRVSLDDSVVRVIDGQPQLIRRAKGYVPTPLHIEDCQGEVLALGGQLKSTFCLGNNSFAYPSQDLGDLDTLENQQAYKKNLEHMLKLFGISPQKVICDLHPNYFTTKLAKEYADTNNLPLVQIQHHHAHVASVMAEQDIKVPVIGVAFDGTGYGEDGAIWGGEFLICHGRDYERVNHLRYVSLIGGDSSMKDGWKSALSLIYERNQPTDKEGISLNLEEFIEYALDNATLEHREIELAEKVLEAKVNVIQSSSMGRLFDGIAAMLGICDYNSYEGKCAMLLEDAAARAILEPGKVEADDLALLFHHRVANMILEEVKKIGNGRNIRDVVLTGGVFQNKILMEETLYLLRDNDFKPHYNISVSPNDGGIALGQCYIAMKRKEIVTDVD